MGNCPTRPEYWILARSGVGSTCLRFDDGKPWNNLERALCGARKSKFKVGMISVLKKHYHAKGSAS